MRFLFLVPDFIPPGPRAHLLSAWHRQPFLAFNPTVRKLLGHPFLRTSVAWGGTLNNMRHCWIARQLGAEAALVSLSLIHI